MGYRHIKVILPLKLAWEPVYRIPDGAMLQIGARVKVKFAGRDYVAVVSELDATPDVDESRIKDVVGVETHLDSIDESELKLWKFIAEYYLCSIGEVYKLAYPAMKTAGEEVKANASIRDEQKAERKAEETRLKIARLEERLKKKEGELNSGKHGAAVTERLESEISRIHQQIEALKVKDEPEQTEPEDWRSMLVRQQEENPISLSVREALKGTKPVLLQGGSKRIDIAMEMAQETLSNGHDVLFLVPDIELSKHLQENARQRCGGLLRVFHSAESSTKRRETATTLRDNIPGSGKRPTLVLGTKSALFLPFRNLGLIIVEEEHDISYKQDSIPRLNCRDTAVMLGAIHNAHVLLASPTPSLESQLNCLNSRYISFNIPSSEGYMEVIDTTKERRKNGMIGNLSRVLVGHIDDAIDQGGKVLVLRPWGPIDDLRDELAARWRDAVADGRISISTTYEARRTNLEGISLLCIVGTDAMLDKQDFRADERAMQALEQLRSRLNGLMVIQTKQSAHQVFNRSIQTSSLLLEERKLFNYPPYTRMVDIVIKDTNESRLGLLSSALAAELAPWHPIGPYTPLRGRTPIEGTQNLRIVLAKDNRLKDEKKKIAEVVSDFETSRKYTGHIVIDVDPA